MTDDAYTDFLIKKAGDPTALDATIRGLPGVQAQMRFEQDGTAIEVNGCYVARVAGDKNFFLFAVRRQGYCTVVGEVPTGH